MSISILVATEKPFAPEAVRRIAGISEEAGYSLKFLEEYSSAKELREAVKEADALIIRSDRVTAEILAAARKLKVVVRAGSGYDNVDCAAASANNIVVMNTPGQNSNGVAELAFGLMISLARGLYQGKAGTELRGKRIGIHGYGNVGKYMVKIANGFGMEIEAYGRSLSPGQVLADGAAASRSVQELYRSCDYVSLHLPLNETTQRLIRFEMMSKMKPGAALINTARKEIMEEEGLLKMMAERPDFKYASDIAPECKDEMLKDYPDRCFFTAKKMGAQSLEANMNAGIAAVRQVINYLEKGDRSFQVN